MLCREPLGWCGPERASDWHQVAELRSVGAASEGCVGAVRQHFTCEECGGETSLAELGCPGCFASTKLGKASVSVRVGGAGGWDEEGDVSFAV